MSIRSSYSLLVVAAGVLLLFAMGCPPDTDGMPEVMRKAVFQLGCNGCEPVPEEGEGEGEAPEEGEGEAPVEGEGEAPVEGEGEGEDEGESEGEDEGEAPRPILAVTPTSVSTDADGGDTTITVENTGTADMTWTAHITLGGLWLSVLPESGVLVPDETATLAVAWNANTATVPRSGVVRVMAEHTTGSPVDISIQQAAALPQAELSVTPLSRVIAHDTEETTFFIQNAGTGAMTWQLIITEGDNWLATDREDGELRAGDSTRITVACELNTNATERTGVIQVAAENAANSPVEVSVVQLPESIPEGEDEGEGEPEEGEIAEGEGETPTPTLAVTPASVEVASDAGSASFSIVTTAPWQAAVIGGGAWATLTSPAAGIGNASLTVTILENMGAERVATIGVASENTVPQYITVTITQAASDSPEEGEGEAEEGETPTPTLEVIPAAVAAPSDADTVSFSIVTTATWQAGVVSGGAWATLTSPAAGVGNTTLTVDVAENTGAERVAVIGVGSENTTPAYVTVSITQAAHESPEEGEPEVIPGEMILVPDGSFEMGRPYAWGGADWIGEEAREVPVHMVTLDAYEIGKYPVTNQEYADVLNWALTQGYLENSNGNAYGDGLVYAYGQPIADTQNNHNYSRIIYNSGTFSVGTREGHGGVMYSMTEHPVVMVSWYGAAAYCNWLSAMQGLQPVYDTTTWERITPLPNGYRLPTEAEWERAAAWDGTKHWRYGITSDTLDNMRANYYNNNNPLGLIGGPYTSPVGWYNGVNISPNGSVQTMNAKSPMGTYDMAGNVFEWCHDWWLRTYTVAPVSNPDGPATGPTKLLRGGSNLNFDSGCRAAYRGSFSPETPLYYSGFRVARTP